jgi:hypothetical protein
MRVLCLALTLAFGVVPTLTATVLIPAEFSEVVSGSQIIVHGRVVEVRSEWVEGRSRIESFITIESATFYRGSPVSSLTFRTPGGQVGRYKSVMVGAPEFRVGDEAVLFLKARGPEVPRIFGLNQGLFRVTVDRRTGRRLVMRPPLVSHGASAERVVRGDPDRRLLTLDAFGAQVRATLRQGGRR